MRRVRARLLLLVTGGLTVLSGCGGDSGPQAPAQTPTIAISAPASLELTQGAGGTATVTLTRGGGFTGAVSVAVEGLPAGVTAPAVSIASGATSAVVNLTAAATAVVATSNLTFRATGTGVSAATAATSLVLKAATVTPTPGAFSVSLSPATLSLAQGASQNVTATITRSGSFTGAVNLAVTGGPAGLTATVTPASVTGTTATIALTAGATLPASAIALTVTGTGTGAANVTASLGVTVTAGTPNPGTGNVSWSFCGTSGLPVWLAAQDGTGAWTRVTGTADAYAFSIASGRGGVAYVAPAGAGFTMEVFYGTTAELQGRGTELCGGPVGAGKTVTGTLAGTAPTDIVLASLGRSLGTASGSAVTWAGVAAGSVDLVASRQALAINGTSVTANLNKMIIRRGLNPAAGSALPVLDFGAAEAFDPISRNVTINNLGTDQSLVVGSYITANGTTIGSYLTDISGGTATTRGWKGVPTANQVAGDFHLLNVSAVGSLTQVLNSTRNAGIVFRDAVDKTVTLGPTLGTSTVTTIASAPYVRPRSAFAAQTEYNRYFVADYQQGNGALARKTQVQQTGGYAAGAPTLDVPDLSTVAGFDANWGLKTGSVVTWTLSATGWSGTGGVASTPFVEGSTYLSATRMGQFTP